MEAPEAQILPFRRPDMIIFERFDLEDMAALFRSKQGRDVYLFTLLSDGTLEEALIEQEGAIVSHLPDFTEEQKKVADRLAQQATTVMTEQLATWHRLGPTEQISLLLAWGQDTLQQLQASIQVAVERDAIEYAEEISLMCQDIQHYEAYLSGLETAKSLL